MLDVIIVVSMLDVVIVIVDIAQEFRNSKRSRSKSKMKIWRWDKTRLHSSIGILSTIEYSEFQKKVGFTF